MSSRNNSSPHILNASSNLLGLCFIVLTSIHVLHLKATTIIDELTTVAILLFMISCILSFMALRSATHKGDRYEKVADIFFIGGLGSMFLTIMLVAFGAIA